MSQRAKVAANQIETVFDLSPMQQGMLLRHSELPEDRSYVMQVRYRIEGSFDRGIFTQAIQEVTQRHPMLRAGFVHSGLAQPKTVVYRQVEPRVEVRKGPIDKESLDALCAQEIRQGFDLRFAPLMKWLVVEIGEQEFELCKTYHHLITDGFASARIMRELIGAYLERSAAGRRTQLPSAPADFSEYIKWLSSQPKDKAKRYWADRLKGVERARAVRGGRNEQAVQSCELSLSRALSQNLSRWTQEHSCTFASLLQGALGLLTRVDRGDSNGVLGVVSRLSPPQWGEDDFAVGPMIATLPLVMPEPCEGQRWGEYIRGIQDLGFQDRQHAQLSLAEITALAPSELRGGSLFDGLLVVENWGSGQLHASQSSSGSLPQTKALDLKVSTQGLRDGSEYPLTVYAVPGESWGFRIHVDEERLGQGAAQRWAQGLVQILQSLLEHACTPGDSVRALRQRTLQEESPPHRNVVAGDPWTRLQYWAAQTPDAVAVQMDRQAWSYTELVDRAQRVAGFLAGQGIGHEDRVALVGPRGPWMLAAILGIWARGAAFVPVDLEGPTQRAQLIVDDAQLAATLCAPSFSPPEVLRLGPSVFGYEQWSQACEPLAPTCVHPEQLAYLMWTSGSTGVPKGVAVSRGALSHFLSAMREVIPMREGQRWLSITGLGFDISVLELFYPMLVGGVCELVDRGTAQDGQALVQCLQRGQVDVFQATASSWQMILDAGLSAPGLFALCGGEALSPALAQSLAAKVGVLVNVYGPTEATIWASAGQVQGGGAPVSIGRALEGVRIDVVNERQALAMGQGELAIAGPTLARGYWRSPRQTAVAFGPDPLGSGSRRYRSGDLGYENLAGDLYCLGRSDRQVKIRGHRIDLLEIEAAMLRSELGLGQACALLIPDRGTQRVLVGAYTAPAAVDPNLLRARVARSLPFAAIPVRWVHLAHFPTNDRDKRDDRALAQQLAQARREPTSSQGSPALLPQGGLESLVTQLWIQHLGQGGDPEDDFFAQGGHSLVAMRMSARLEPVLGYSIPVAWLLTHPRREDWIARLVQGPEQKASLPALPASSAWPARFAATPAQRRFFWLERRAPRPGHYNLMVAVAIDARVEDSIWRSAFERICNLHPMLKTRLLRRGDGLVCELYPGSAGDPDPEWGWVSTPANTDVDRLIQNANEYRFELEAKPAWWAQVCDQDQGGSALVFCAHHALVDGRSLELLMRDLALLVNGKAEPSAPALEFPAYAQWMAKLEHEGVLDRHAAFWRDRLPSSMPPQALAFSGFGPLTSLVEERPRIELDAEFCQRWRTFNQEQLCTHFMVLLAAMFRWLVPMTGQTHLCIGAPHLGRGDRRLADVVGPFVSTLAWSLDLSDRPDTKALIARVRSLVLAGQQHELAPLERSYDPKQGTPFLALLSLQVQSDNVDAPQAKYLSRPSARHKGAITLYAKLSKSGSVQLELSYDPQQWSAGYARQALDELQACVKSLIDRPTAPLPQPALLSSASLPAPVADCSLIEVFARVAKSRPHAVALEFGEQRISYGELWNQVQGLATALAEQGVRAGDLVALELPRGLSVVVRILGVMACGAAYLPLEPEWPQARKERLVSQSGALGPVVERGESYRWSVSRLLSQDRPHRDLSHRWSPDLVAYVLYTSGSTGEPKGVAVTQRNVMSLLRACSQSVSLSEKDCWSCTHSFSFDFSVWELWGALVHGARLRVLSHEERRDPQRVLEILRAANVTVFSQTPSAFYAFAANARRTQEPASVASLRYVIFGGESLDGPALTPWRSWVQGRGPTLVNMYGITETTVHVTAGKVPAEGVASVGLPLPGVNVELVAPDLSPVLAGAQGEILVGGWGVSLGYWNNPRLTAQRFLPDPHAQIPGARRYRSGDLAQLLPDGTLLYLGRKDQQVQIRGHRVEPGELAARLQAHPCVEQTAVLVRFDSQRVATGLVGFYTASSTMNEEELARFVQQGLPSYLWPQALHRVPRLPRTANDKLDEQALWALEPQGSEPLHSGLEQLIAQRFSKALGKRVGAQDDFFALGGHSLLAVDLVHDLSAAIGQELSVGQLFAHPNPRALAEFCATDRRSGTPRWVALSGEARDTWVLCVHPGGGHLQGYAPLAQHLSQTPLQVWGVACPSMDDPRYLASSIEAMAEQYLRGLEALMNEKSLRRVYLLGWSSGAVVASAMAHRWSRHCAPLEGVFLLDPPTPGSRVDRAGPAPSPLPEPHWKGFLAAVGVGESDARVRALSTAQRSHWEQGWAKAHQEGQPWTWLAKQMQEFEEGPPLSAQLWRWRYQRLVHAAHLVSQYQPEPLGVPVHCWRAQPRGSSLAQEAASSWICAPTLREYAYAGSHGSIVSDLAVAQQILALMPEASLSPDTTDSLS